MKFAKLLFVAVLAVVLALGAMPAKAWDSSKIPKGAKRLESAYVHHGCVFDVKYCDYTHYLYVTFTDGTGWYIQFWRGTTFEIAEMPELDGTYMLVKSKEKGAKKWCTIYVRNVQTKTEWDALIERYHPKPPIDVVPR